MNLPRLLLLVAAIGLCQSPIGHLAAQPAPVLADPTTGALFRPTNLVTPLGNATGTLLGASGGTGVANTGKTITLGGNVTTVGAYNLGVSLSGNTTVTLPTTGTLATLAGSETLTNKTLTSPTLTTPILGAATATSVTGPTTTDLTLTGGSTGASLVLGQGSGIATFNRAVQITGLESTVYIASGGNRGLYGIEITNANSGDRPEITLRNTGTGGRQYEISSFGAATGEFRITNATDGYVPLRLTGTSAATASLNLSAITTASTNTTSGALIVGGGVGVSGAMNVGGAITAGASFTPVAFGNVAISVNDAAGGIIAPYYAGTTPGYLIADSATTLTLQARSSVITRLFNAAAKGLTIAVTTGDIDLNSTTSASSSTVGALTVGNGTAATNVAIGGGNINAGGTLTVGGVASISTGTSAAFLDFVTSGTTTSQNIQFTDSGGASGAIIYTHSTNAMQFKTNGDVWATLGNTGNLSLASTTPSTLTTNGALVVTGGVGVGGAMNVGGAVTVGGTVIHTLSATPASATAAGTVGTMSWDANYIYICTATNTWKRVAIATW